MCDDVDQRAFHDFVIARGLLPPELLRQAVLEELPANPHDTRQLYFGGLSFESWQRGNRPHSDGVNIMRITIFRLLAILCTLTISATASAQRINCTINIDVIFPTGEVFRGTGSDIDEAEMVDFVFEALDYTFETVGDPGISGDPNGVQCRQNGVITADVISEGTALIDGVPGFSYLIEIEDNRPVPADTIRLGAVLIQRPRNSIENSMTYDAARVATIPATIPVLVGAAGNGRALLSLDKIRCRYRGTGADYAFEGCGGPGGRGILPGDTLSVTEAKLRLITAERAFPVTSVLVDLGAVPTGDADIFLLEVFNADGTFFRGSAVAVEIGDVEIVPVE